MARLITLYHFGKTPPKVVGQVRLSDSNVVSFANFDPHSRILQQLKHGIPAWPDHTTVVLPSAGVDFFNRVRGEFAGALVRAVEETTE